MRPQPARRRWPALAAGALLTLGGCAVQPPQIGATAPEAVVRAFNAAITDRRLEAALGLLAEGGVQFNLRAAHGFAAEAGASPLTSDLAAQWRAVAAVLFASTRSYRRELLSASTHAEGDLAVVWAQVRTTSERLDVAGRSSMSFAEAYLLRRAGGRWQIVGMASDRPTR